MSESIGVARPSPAVQSRGTTRGTAATHSEGKRVVDRRPVSSRSLPATVRVVVVDPRPERRSLTSSLLNAATGASVVGEAATRSEALMMMDQLDVDAVMVEIQMPVDEGLRTVEEIRLRAPRVRIVVCSFWSDAGTRALALRAGADGYFAKPMSGRDVVNAITAVPRARS